MTEKTIRREDERLLTGRGCYTADVNLPGQLYAHVLRSDRAHANILSIDTAAALKRPGVKLVLTWADLAAEGVQSLPGGVTFEGIGGRPMGKPFWPALAAKRVHFVGQPVALLVAESLHQAQDAAEDIVIDYEELPAVVGFEAATRPGAVQLHAEAPGNMAFEYESGDRAAVEQAFAAAKHVSRMTMNSQRLVGSPMEPRAFIADYDAASGTLTAYTPSQGIAAQRAQLAKVTGIATEKVRVITRDVGGSFGLRSPPYPEHIAVVAASRRLGRPVKWVAMRSELFLSENHGRALSLTGELALDADGRFLALRFDDRADLGAYATNFGALIASRGITVTMGGVYRIPAMYARCRLAYTNTAQVSSYRGAGRPDIAAAIERLVDHAAAEHGFDPVELRRRNFVPREAMPYRTANGTTYDCGEFEAVMDKALGCADWAGFAARRTQSTREGKLRGIGMATFLEASAAGFVPKDEALAKFDARGDLHLYLMSQAGGQGHETSFAKIVCAELGVQDERVHIHEGDPDHTLVGNATGGSRSLYGAGSALKLLAAKIIETAAPHAAVALAAETAAVAYRDGAFHAADRRIGLCELAASLAPRVADALSAGHPLDCVAEGVFGATFPNGCHIAEVEIDPDSGAVDLVAYTTVDDVGNAIDPTSVEGQVHGGVMQGVGQVLGENTVYDADTGQLLSGSFMDYAMPHADWMRGIRCEEHNVPTKKNLLGAKGVGESGTSGALPAAMNAILNALRPAGVTEFDMPATADRVWRALDASRGKAARTAP